MKRVTQFRDHEVKSATTKSKIYIQTYWGLIHSSRVPVGSLHTCSDLRHAEGDVRIRDIHPSYILTVEFRITDIWHNLPRAHVLFGTRNAAAYLKLCVGNMSVGEWEQDDMHMPALNSRCQKKAQQYVHITRWKSNSLLLLCSFAQWSDCVTCWQLANLDRWRSSMSWAWTD